jgi:hypothetical protein
MIRRVVEVKLRWGLGGIPQLIRVIMSALFISEPGGSKFV